jgi:DNA-binding NtrC family response regulator
MSAHILIADDDEVSCQLFAETLEAEGLQVEQAISGDAALSRLREETPDLLIVDVRMPGTSGLDVTRIAHQKYPSLPIIVMTAFGSIETAVEAIHEGAFDFISKPMNLEELKKTVSRALAQRTLQRPAKMSNGRDDENPQQLGKIIGKSPAMLEVYKAVARAAPTKSTVLILGESGTGKELIAGAIHSLSERRSAPYVRINCAAIPETLLESELFGHEKGAFTGAIKQKSGRVEEADGGTIFLDEIGDMSRPLQAKLLRFLEDGSFTRVGGNDELRVNVRLLAATNRDIVEAIREHQFREDLFHRLNVMQFRPPPLRERGTDIVLLAEHFLRHFSTTMRKQVKGLSTAAKQKLLGHHWPGNVRELRNVIERAVILETTAEIQARNLPDFLIESSLKKAESPHSTVGQSLDDAMAHFERELIQQTLEQNRFSVSRAAEQLKLTRHALRYRMQRLNINSPADTEEEPAHPA